MKGTYKFASGSFEAQVHSAGGPNDTNCKLTLGKLIPSTSLSVSATSTPDLTVEANYQQGNITSLLTMNHNDAKGAGLTVSGTFAISPVVLGAQVGVDVSSGGLKDYGLAAQANLGDIQATIRSEKRNSNLSVSIFQPLGGGLSWGASLGLQPADFSSRTLTLGTHYNLDKSTFVKARANTSGVVGIAVSHKLANPSLKFGVSAEFDTASDTSAAKKVPWSVELASYYDSHTHLLSPTHYSVWDLGCV